MSDLDEKPTTADATDAGEQDAADAVVLNESRRHTRRAFAIAAVGAAAGYGAYRWMGNSPGTGMQLAPFRKAFDVNAKLSRAVFDDRAMAPTYPLKRAEDLRVNGVYGLKQTLIPESWRLQMTGVENAHNSPRYVADVTAWEYRYADTQTQEDQGHDTESSSGRSRRGHGGEDGARLHGSHGKGPPGSCRPHAARPGRSRAQPLDAGTRELPACC